MLQIHDLQFGYGKQALLNINDYTLKDREHLLVRGNSGSGKTSLLFLLAGLLKPNKGAITLNGTDITKLFGASKDRFRGQNLGFVFQQPHLMAALTIRQNLLVVPFMAGEAIEASRVDALLKKLGLESLADRYPSQLSQGQQQRVGLARALIHRPKLVLADEPTSALDDHAAESALNLLLESAEQAGAQVVVTSHDNRIASRFKHTLKLEARA
jgi:ABC-type lipoprotein export system ATPase subunit